MNLGSCKVLHVLEHLLLLGLLDGMYLRNIGCLRGIIGCLRGIIGYLRDIISSLSSLLFP